MDTATKAGIAKATLVALLVVVILFIFGMASVVICAGIGINPFQARTTETLVSGFFGLMGVGTGLLFLNVAANLSMIADAQLTASGVALPRRRYVRWAVAFAGGLVILVAAIGAGTLYSKQSYLEIVRNDADSVLATHPDQVDRIGNLLGGNEPTSPENGKEIRDILAFLSKQRAGLPPVAVLFPGMFEGAPAKYSIASDDCCSEEAAGIKARYYSCLRGLDCDYLEKFFRDAMSKPWTATRSVTQSIIYTAP